MRLRKLQAQFQGRISVQWHPFALRPEKNAASFEFKGSYVERGWKSAASMTRSDGISFQMWDQRPLPRWSLPGLYAGTAAQRQGPQLFERFHIDMFAAYFGRSEDITSKDVAVEVARRSGLDVDRFSKDVDDEELQAEVLKRVIEAMSVYQVSAVPTVIVDGGISMQGAVPEKDYLGAFAKARPEPRWSRAEGRLGQCDQLRLGGLGQGWGIAVFVNRVAARPGEVGPERNS